MSACPGDDTLIALVEHALPAARVEAIADHVDGCPRCRATIGHLAAVAPDVSEPAMIGRYRLEDQLGSGGMGIVWAAFDSRLERRVAIKLVRPEVGEHGPARLLREARALAQLQHPNIVAVFDVGEHGGEVFLATELVDGESLDRWQRDRSPAAILGAYVQAARGLAAAHAIGLVHRDVKPSNLFVARDGRVRVGDFGLARSQREEPAGGEDGGGVSSAAPPLTQDGAIVGTPAYMAPEQRAGQAVDARADQYALCVSLAEALTGTRPAPDTRVFAGVAKRIASALTVGLRMDPDARFVDMTALAEQLTVPAMAPVRWPLVVGGIALVAALAAGVTAAVTARGASVGPFPPIARVAASPAPVVSVAAPPIAGSPVTAPVAAPRPTAIPSRPSGPPVVAARASGSTTAEYLDAVTAVNARDATCVARLAHFDARQVPRPAAIDSRTDTLLRARCELLAGRCAQGERALRALFTADGLSRPTIDAETRREVDRSCPASVGTWRERLSHLEGKVAVLMSASASELGRALADAERIARDGGGAMTAADRIDLGNTAGFIEEGFARLADHCRDARRARALAAYDPPGMTPALAACLTTSAP